MINLKNKKAVITGATGGIGYSILEKFHSEGMTVLGSGTNDEKLSKLKKDFSGAIFQKFDISKHDEIEKFVDEVCSELDGCPEILINNAGITKDNLSLRMSQKEWQQVIEFDKKIRNNSRKKEVEVFVHRSCKPISEVDLDIEENQLNLFNDECSGYCGN